MVQQLSSPRPSFIAGLIRRLGDIPPERIRMVPAPGTATVADVEKNKLCELVEGTLVDKPMAAWESLAAVELSCIIRNYSAQGRICLLTGADGPYRLFEGIVRLPDIAYVAKTNLPQGFKRQDPVWQFAPDLVVEVFNPGNTAKEMKVKRKAYFDAGVKEVWMVYPRKRSIAVYKSITNFETLKEPAVLDGGTILPGFRLSLKEYFDIVYGEDGSAAE